MKKKLMLSVLAASALASSVASAAPIVLPGATPLFLQYNNAEQFSASNSIPIPGGGGATEGNWGIAQISIMVKGTALPPPGSDIAGGGAPIFVDQILPLGAQVLGIFYGVQNDPFTGSPFTSTGGRFDLYWWEGAPAQNVGTELASSANLAKHTAQNEYTGFTCAAGNTAQCTFLLSATFESGANPGDPGTTIVTPSNPGSNDGTSKSYLSVDTTKVGAWTSALDGNYFTLDPCNNPVAYNYAAGGEICPTTGTTTFPTGGVSFAAAQDIRLDNNFTRNGGTAWDVAQTDIIGLRSNDPARAVTVPEPGSLVLMGLAMAIAGGLARRRREHS